VTLSQDLRCNVRQPAEGDRKGEKLRKKKRKGKKRKKGKDNGGKIKS
jgi:hypothetical protein